METSCWGKDGEIVVNGIVHIWTDTKKGLRVKILLLSGSVILIFFFFWALWTGSLTVLSTKVILYVMFTLGLGLLMLAATLYGGFVRQYLIVNKKGVTYTHWPLRKLILWTELEKVEFLGVNFPGVRSYAVVFRSRKTKINVASDFEREDLQRLYKHLKQLELKHDFVIEDGL